MTAAAEDKSGEVCAYDGSQEQNISNTSPQKLHVHSMASESADQTVQKGKKRQPRHTNSPYFPVSPLSKRSSSAITTTRKNVSCIPFPPLSTVSFGLAQERLANEPFWLLIAVIFLNKTRGTVAMPVFYKLMQRYPTTELLAAAEHDDVLELIQHLGLQNQRAKSVVTVARAWLEHPPARGKRYRCLHYPKKGDGSDVKRKEIVADETEDPRVGWEVAHLPGLGAYAFDSWRIFCRDSLRGVELVSEERIGEEDEIEEDGKSQPEWTRVVPMDKELRAYLKWRWLKAGWIWDPLTGNRERATADKLTAFEAGGVTMEGEEIKEASP